MSAYGSISGPKAVEPLPALVYPLKKGSVSTHTIVDASDAPETLVDYLYSVFAQEVEGELHPY